jgi:hypothetical protein
VERDEQFNEAMWCISKTWQAEWCRYVLMVGTIEMKVLIMLFDVRCATNRETVRVAVIVHECVHVFLYKLDIFWSSWVCFAVLNFIEGSLEVKLPTIWTFEKQR